jgi:CBS domain containing-hemolysin-like protein
MEGINLKSDEPRSKKKPSGGVWRWIVSVFLITVCISAGFSYVSSALLNRADTVVAFAILFVIVLIGILFDMIGVAVAAAEEKPFHSMAARKVPEAPEALRLVKNAARVSSICNDVIGDICGVVSGSASAIIAAEIVVNFTPSAATVIRLLMSALVAGLTVGGKACGKSLAMRESTKIIHAAAKVIWFVKAFPGSARLLWQRRKSQNRGMR